MNQQDKQAAENQESQVDDLTVNQDRAADVTGGAVVHGTTVLAWARIDG
ncbi:MAG TPA: hypothetical protein VLM38_14075 [Blastocatellia bacterium]|nr:hypothetical protein [Blastocatellia bacterium]